MNVSLLTVGKPLKTFEQEKKEAKWYLRTIGLMVVWKAESDRMEEVERWWGGPINYKSLQF